MQTFTDDPLRVLRAIRFANRFGFRLHEDIARAAVSPSIRVNFRARVSALLGADDSAQDALHRKISRERILKELEGMLSCTSLSLLVFLFFFIGVGGFFFSHRTCRTMDVCH